MDVAKVVKEVFFVLMCAFVMVFLYNLLFSTKDTGNIWYNITGFEGNTRIESAKTGKQDGSSDGIPDGAIWHMAYTVQIPISQYYYAYCYFPNAHMNDVLDVYTGFKYQTGSCDYAKGVNYPLFINSVLHQGSIKSHNESDVRTTPNKYTISDGVSCYSTGYQ